VQDCLQPGRRQLAAGYILYGYSTMLVYSTGAGVHGFTLDPSIGEFLLSHPEIRVPDSGQGSYSVNEGNSSHWSAGQRAFVDRLKGRDGSTPLTSRYIGSMVGDVHRTLMKGGIFMYPSDARTGTGKLRLLYEASPMAFIMEQAGGKASSGTEPILDIQPEGLHQRVPLYIGDAALVDEACRYLAADGVPD
ncbi:MAG: fructose-1,6-bisphosphatase, partial [Gemmatimonadota bacterium]